MIHLLPLALKSAWNRRYTLGLTVLAIALSVTLLLGIERLRQDTREGFAQAISGTDLVVGARSSPLQLLLYAVFHLGEATHNLGWDSLQALAAHPAVEWVVPISLGDSHRGFPVLGTTPAYFEHFRHGNKQALRFTQGRPFQAGLERVYEAVLGAETAHSLGLKPGAQITLSHGSGDTDLAEHADKPFTVAGVLAPTGTPVDRTVHISLAGMEAIHLDWQGGAPMPGAHIPAEMARKFDLTPKSVTAALVGLKSRTAVFAVQRWVAAYRDEPLMAVLPGVALSQLWELMGTAERALQAMSALVLAVSLAGLAAVVLASLNERRRELAILRANGARPRDVLALLLIEGLGAALAGAALGVALLTALSALLAPWLLARYGIPLQIGGMREGEALLLVWVGLAALIASLLPAWRAYRLSLADGLTPRI